MSLAITHGHPSHRRLFAPAALRIVIVDASRANYESWLAEQRESEVVATCVTDGQAALRLARSEYVDLWVVNVELSDMSGLDLCQMLKSRFPSTPVYLVSNTYSPELERAAYAARASVYGAKPAHLEWLSQWLSHWQRGRELGALPPTHAAVR